MQIGRKIYYDKATGNVIIDTGERNGDLVETTTEQDFESYIALNQHVPETVGMIHLEYGQYLDKFGRYAYHVDVDTQTIVWDLTPIQQEEIVSQQTLEEKVADLQARLQAAETDNLNTMLALTEVYEMMIGGV